MFTQTVDYALRIAICLAESGTQSQTADEISRQTCVPRAYLAKVIQILVRGEIIRSKRGVGGGVSLAKRPEELTLLDIVNAIDPIKRPEPAPASPEGPRRGFQELHRRCEQVYEQFEQIFSESTLDDCIGAPHENGSGVSKSSQPRFQPVDQFAASGGGRLNDSGALAAISTDGDGSPARNGNGAAHFGNGEAI